MHGVNGNNMLKYGGSCFDGHIYLIRSICLAPSPIITLLA